MERNLKLPACRTIFITPYSLSFPQCYFNFMIAAKTEGKRDRMVYEAIKAKKSLNEAKKALKKGLSLDFVEVDVKNAYAYLGNITGDTASEEVINKVFERFCLGK